MSVSNDFRHQARNILSNYITLGVAKYLEYFSANIQNLSQETNITTHSKRACLSIVTILFIHRAS